MPEAVGVSGVAARRWLLGALVAGLAAWAVVAVLDRADRRAPAPAPTTAGPHFPQRLLWIGRDFIEEMNGPVMVQVDDLDGLVELLPDGTVVPVPMPEGMNRQPAVAELPGGRLAWLRPTGGVPRVEPSAKSGQTLTVTGPDGAVVARREVPVSEYLTQLAGGTGPAVYLVHGDRIVAHDIATGAERHLVPLSGRHTMSTAAADVVVTRLARSPREDGDCALDVADLVAARVVRTLSVPGPCLAIRLSPDGRYLAVDHLPPATVDPLAQKVTVLNVGSGAVVAERVQRDGPRWPQEGSYSRGMAWIDLTTVRVGWVEFPGGADRTYPIAEVLHTADLKVP